jgi:SAM-dependent methyltransferase
MILEIILFLLFFIIFVFLCLPLFFGGAPYLPSYKESSDRKYLEELFEFLEKYRNKNSKFIDLGSGDGRIVIEFAKRNYESYGIEMNPFLVFLSKLKIRKAGLKNAKIIWGNFWKIDLSRFDIIYFFQYKLANKFLMKKLLKESKNKIIISAHFPLENLKPQKSINGFYIYFINQ